MTAKQNPKAGATELRVYAVYTPYNVNFWPIICLQSQVVRVWQNSQVSFTSPTLDSQISLNRELDQGLLLVAVDCTGRYSKYSK